MYNVAAKLRLYLLDKGANINNGRFLSGLSLLGNYNLLAKKRTLTCRSKLITRVIGLDIKAYFKSTIPILLKVSVVLILGKFNDSTNGFRKFTRNPLTMGAGFGTINR